MKLLKLRNSLALEYFFNIRLPAARFVMIEILFKEQGDYVL